MGHKHCIACANGTDALLIALMVFRVLVRLTKERNFVGFRLLAVPVFSTRPLGYYGDGGACFTKDGSPRYERSSLLQTRSEISLCRMGINSRLEIMHAAALLAKMEIVDVKVNRQDVIGKKYTKMLGDIPSVRAPYIEKRNRSVYAQYIIRVRKRDEF